MRSKIVVVVDTTTTYTDVMMTKTPWMQLLALCARGDVDLAIPDIVVRETQRHWRTKTEEQLDGLRKKLSRLANALNSLSDLGVKVDLTAPTLVTEPEVNKEVFYRETCLRLEAIGAELLPMPSVAIEDLLERDLEGLKPFAESGKGFRDTLIWESLKELLGGRGSGSTFFFVTANDDDYREEGALHRDLATELSGQDPELVLVRDLSELLARPEFKPLVSALERSNDDLGEFLAEITEEASLEATVDLPFVVSDVIASALEGAIAELANEEVKTFNDTTGGLNFTDLDIPAEVESPSISSVDVRAASLDWNTYATYDDTTLLVRATVDAAVGLSGFVYKSDLGVLEDADIGISDWDWNDHMASVFLSVDARLVFQLRVELGVGVEDVIFETAEAL